MRTSGIHALLRSPSSVEQLPDELSKWRKQERDSYEKEAGQARQLAEVSGPSKTSHHTTNSLCVPARDQLRRHLESMRIAAEC
jgi:hypothetical protein